MAVLSGATASGLSMFHTTLSTTLTTYYTAPVQTANVTGNSSTAYVKEIVLCNNTSSAITVNVQVGGAYFINTLTVNANDTKVLSGLNTMMTAGSVIKASASGSCDITVSGVEIQ